MPFDGKLNDTFAFRRALLIDALRHMPPTHKWDFHYSGGRVGGGSVGCAVGLAHAIGIIDESYCQTLFMALGLSNEVGLRLFDAQGESNAYGVPTADVTPSMVADALEKIDC